jgi:heavy metal sensor kinase
MLTLLLVSGFLYLSLSRFLYGNLDSQLVADAGGIVNGLDDVQGRVRLGEQVVDVTALYDPASGKLLDGNSLLVTGVAGEGRARVRRTGTPDLRTADLGARGEWRVLTRSVTRGGRTVAILQVARPLEPIETVLERLLLLMGASIPPALLLATAGGLFLAGRALMPIDRITRAAERIGAENLSRRLEVPPTRDEVARLAATLNGMIARLDASFARQRQFTADASHELRTPLAIIRSQAEVTLSRARTAREYREALDNIAADADRMSALVGDLLTLARADAGEERLALEPVPLGELVAGVVEQLRPLASARDVALERSGEESGPIVRGDQTRLTQLALNVVENAIKYSPGGRVEVGLSRADGSARLVVSDTGIGIPAEHLPHLFERFYRVDKARSRAEGGSGLGLAICAWIAGAHGGAIQVESVPGGGSVFTVVLPLEGPAATTARVGSTSYGGIRKG